MTGTDEIIRTMRMQDDLAPHHDLLSRAIDACFACTHACTSCADACLGEPDVGAMAACVRTDLDCADICATTARVLARGRAADLALLESVLQSCVFACRLCAVECGRHADHHDHCRVCANACRACEDACRAVLDAFGNDRGSS